MKKGQTPVRPDEVVAMLRTGKPIRAVAAAFERDPTTISKIAKAAGYAIPLAQKSYPRGVRSGATAEALRLLQNGATIIEAAAQTGRRYSTVARIARDRLGAPPTPHRHAINAAMALAEERVRAGETVRAVAAELGVTKNAIYIRLRRRRRATP